jgi:hypothetical protein
MSKFLFYQALITEIFAIAFMIVFFFIILFPCSVCSVFFSSSIPKDIVSNIWLYCSIFWAVVCGLVCNVYLWYADFQQIKKYPYCKTYSDVLAHIAS